MKDIETPIVKESCGCLILAIAKKGKRDKTNLSGFRIEHCRLHKAAPALLAACEHAFATYKDGLTDNERKLFPESAKEYDMLKQAIAQAES